MEGPAAEQGDAGEERAQEMSTTDEEDSRVPSAPDVTYDATVLEQNQHSGETGGEGGEARTTNGASKERAVRFKEEEVAGREEREGGDKREKEEEEKDEWMDILGSGDLKKKVRWQHCRSLGIYAEQYIH